MVEDEIVIVDHSHRIVDVVPAGSRAHYGRAGSSTESLNLSEPEVRELQQVLITRGFYHGRVDGVFGPEMREAVISFQRKQGFATTGSIDTRKVSALGLSGRSGQNAQGAGNRAQEPSGGSGATGQAPASQQKSSEQENAPTQSQSENQPANGRDDPPRRQQPNGNNQSSQSNPAVPPPSTTGQGSKGSDRSQKQRPSDR